MTSGKAVLKLTISSIGLDPIGVLKKDAKSLGWVYFIQCMPPCIQFIWGKNSGAVGFRREELSTSTDFSVVDDGLAAELDATPDSSSGGSISGIELWSHLSIGSTLSLEQEGFVDRSGLPYKGLEWEGVKEGASRFKPFFNVEERSGEWTEDDFCATGAVAGAWVGQGIIVAGTNHWLLDMLE